MPHAPATRAPIRPSPPSGPARGLRGQRRGAPLALQRPPSRHRDLAIDIPEDFRHPRHARAPRLPLELRRAYTSCLVVQKWFAPPCSNGVSHHSSSWYKLTWRDVSLTVSTRPSKSTLEGTRPGPRRVPAHTEGLPHLEASLRPPWPPTWIWLKLVSPSHLETADECTYLGLLARTATPPPCYRAPIGELSLKAVSRETLKKPARTTKRPLFTLNLHHKSSAKTTNFKA